MRRKSEDQARRSMVERDDPATPNDESSFVKISRRFTCSKNGIVFEFFPGQTWEIIDCRTLTLDHVRRQIISREILKYLQQYNVTEN